jgi:hypothetical protein
MVGLQEERGREDDLHDSTACSGSDQHHRRPPAGQPPPTRSKGCFAGFPMTVHAVASKESADIEAVFRGADAL